MPCHVFAAENAAEIRVSMAKQAIHVLEDVSGLARIEIVLFLLDERMLRGHDISRRCLRHLLALEAFLHCHGQTLPMVTPKTLERNHAIGSAFCKVFYCLTLFLIVKRCFRIRPGAC
jgi:hypothetical protein